MNNAIPNIPKSLPVDFKPPSFKGLKLGTNNVEALEAMEHQGLSSHKAAKRIGIRNSNLRRANERPHLRQVFRELVDFVRVNGAQEAYLRIVELSQTAKSETVRLEANKWLAGIDGVGPVAKMQALHPVTSTGFDYSGKDDVTAD